MNMPVSNSPAGSPSPVHQGRDIALIDALRRAERIRACYQHAVLKWLSGEKMKNSTLCERFGIDKKNAAQASQVISAALEEGAIKVADPDHPRGGYFPFWG